MTLVVGVLCSDGAVIGTDSAATFGTGYSHTIGQQMVTKLRKIEPSGLFAFSGSVGMGQAVEKVLKDQYTGKKLVGVKDPTEFRCRLGEAVGGTTVALLQRAAFSTSLVGAEKARLHAVCDSLLAVPVDKKARLFQFDQAGAGENVTEELPFVALGSGQQIADPFLAFLKRTLWRDSEPTLSEGRLATIWTLHHVIKSNPGGVGGRIQLGTLDGKDAIVHSADAANLHAEMSEKIEKDLRSLLQEHLKTGKTKSIPER